MVLTTEATDHSQNFLCFVNAGFLLLVVGVAVTGAYGADFMTATTTDTNFTSPSVAPPPFGPNLLLCRSVYPGLSLLV